jgi:hypothetical protein
LMPIPNAIVAITILSDDCFVNCVIIYHFMCTMCVHVYYCWLHPLGSPNCLLKYWYKQLRCHIGFTKYYYLLHVDSFRLSSYYKFEISCKFILTQCI